MDNFNKDVHFLLSDHPEYETGKEDYLALHKDDQIYIKSILGTLVFVLIFIFIIPILIKDYIDQEILLSYLANLDLIATAISFKNGPFNLDLFRYLYIDDRPLVGYLSQNIINYFVLLAIVYIAVSKSVKSKNIGHGMAVTSIIFIITYLFPGRIISEGMHFINNKFTNELNLNSYASWYITFIMGLLIALFFIILEYFTVKHFYKPISKIYENIIFKFLHLE